MNRQITSGTAHPGSLFEPRLVRLLPGAADACRELKRVGYALVVVTNQGCVARGEASIAQVEATNARMREVVREQAGVELDGVYFCPYHPKGTVAPWNVEHPWRKPGPGMFFTARDELGLDLSRSWMIGDAERDIEAAIAAGIAVERTVIVGDETARRYGTRTPDLAGAAAAVMHASRRTGM